jgi:hypothetical protein
MLLGTVLRVYRLDYYPPGLHGDEAWTGIEARRILKDGNIGVWSPAAYGQTSLPFYWTAIILKSLGESVSTVRLSFSLFSVVSLLFFYLTIRTIFSPKMAIISTFLLATGPVSLALSRRADYVAANVAFFPALFFFLISIKTNKTLFFILSGILIALNHYMYFAFWLTPLLFAVFILSFILQKKERIPKYLKNFIILFISYLIVAYPILSFWFTNPDAFLTRARIVSSFSSAQLSLNVITQNVKDTLLMFNFVGDHDIWDNFRSLPALDPIAGLFFVIGIILSIFTFKKKQILLIYLPFLFFLAGSFLTTDAPNFRRSQISIYLSYVFVAFGMLQVYSFIVRRFTFLKKPLILLGITLVLYIGFYNTRLYFFEYAISPEAKSILCYELTKASEFIKTIPDSYVYFYSARWSYHYETLRFLLNGIPGEDRSSQFGTYSLNNNNNNKTVIYLFLPDYQNSFFEVQKLYPNGKAIIIKDTDDSVLFYSYIISK